MGKMKQSTKDDIIEAIMIGTVWTFGIGISIWIVTTYV